MGRIYARFALYHGEKIMIYDHKQIAKELKATASGESYFGNALYVARDMDFITDNDRQCLTRYLFGNNTATDRFRLQDIAILIDHNGEMP